MYENVSNDKGMCLRHTYTPNGNVSLKKLPKTSSHDDPMNVLIERVYNSNRKLRIKNESTKYDEGKTMHTIKGLCVRIIRNGAVFD